MQADTDKFQLIHQRLKATEGIAEMLNNGHRRVGCSILNRLVTQSWPYNNLQEALQQELLKVFWSTCGDSDLKLEAVQLQIERLEKEERDARLSL